MEKIYYIQCQIGLAKYVMNYHDGKKKHKDGSEFFDIKIFKNRQKLLTFENELIKKGYKEVL